MRALGTRRSLAASLLSVVVVTSSGWLSADGEPLPAALLQPEETLEYRLHKGESALAAVSWSNTVEVAETIAPGTYLAIAPHTGDRPTTRPLTTDLGTTAKLTLTAWCLKFPS